MAFVQLKSLSITEGAEVGVMSSAGVRGGGAQRVPTEGSLSSGCWASGGLWAWLPRAALCSQESTWGEGSASREGVLLRAGERRDPRQSSGLQERWCCGQSTGAPFPDLKVGSQLKRKQDGISGLSSSFVVLI